MLRSRRVAVQRASTAIYASPWFSAYSGMLGFLWWLKAVPSLNFASSVKGKKKMFLRGGLSLWELWYLQLNMGRQHTMQYIDAFRCGTVPNAVKGSLKGLKGVSERGLVLVKAIRNQKWGEGDSGHQDPPFLYPPMPSVKTCLCPHWPDPAMITT